MSRYFDLEGRKWIIMDLGYKIKINRESNGFEKV